jgi:hypothetical protein
MIPVRSTYTIAAKYNRSEYLRFLPPPGLRVYALQLTRGLSGIKGRPRPKIHRKSPMSECVPYIASVNKVLINGILTCYAENTRILFIDKYLVMPSIRRHINVPNVTTPKKTGSRVPMWKEWQSKNVKSVILRDP